MRNTRFLVGAFVLAVSIIVPSSAFGAAEAIQTIEGQVGGKETPKFDKKKFKKTSIEVETTTADAADPAAVPPKAIKAVIKFDGKDVKFDPSAVPGCNPTSIDVETTTADAAGPDTLMPPKANRAVIVFDKKNVKFNADAVPGCTASQLAGTTTQVAVAACGDAQVGEGDATAALPFGAGGTRQDFPVVVSAFNNGDAEGILLHSRVDSLGTTTTLIGTLNKTTLDVAIPPLGGGVGAIAQFHTNVKAKDYISARCKNKKIKYEGTFYFTDGTPTATATDEQACKQKKKKKNK
jgi:hypothetical protein